LTFLVDHKRMHCHNLDAARFFTKTVFKHGRVAHLCGHDLGKLKESTLRWTDMRDSVSGV
jgi:hypothetical protein